MNEALSNLGSENRTFAPSQEFAAQANVKADIYVDDKGINDEVFFLEADSGQSAPN